MRFLERKIRFFFLAFVVLSVIAVAASVMMRSGRNAYKVEFTEDKKIGVRIDNVHYSSNRNGRVEWTLEAASAVRMKDDDTAILDEVDMVFYAKDGASYRLKAKKARFRESIGELTAEGDVTVTSASGVGLKTEKIKYSVKTARVTSNERVELRALGMVVTGVGLLSEIDNGRFFLFKDVKAVLNGG
ncbi:MAG: LPS export ABC transporter periplasmic protein LptC [Deltaproteobacteria bacterium]|nr:LPS export ABC transporter periplasmic protein LptC [Deltaproteobacteria bacterium]